MMAFLIFPSVIIISSFTNDKYYSDLINTGFTLRKNLPQLLGIRNKVNYFRPLVLSNQAAQQAYNSFLVLSLCPFFFKMMYH